MRFGSKILVAAFALAASGTLVAAQEPAERPGAFGPGQGPRAGAMQRHRLGPQDGPQGHMGRPQFGRRGMRQGRGGKGFGRPGIGRPGKNRGAGLGRALRNPQVRERLGVTAEQAAKIQAQETGFAKSRIQTRANLRVQRMELRDLMRAEKPDRAAIEKKMRAINEAQLAGQLGAMDHRVAMQNALTPEQKVKMKEWRQEQRQQFQQRPGFGPQRGPMRRQGPPERPAPPPAE